MLPRQDYLVTPKNRLLGRPSRKKRLKGATDAEHFAEKRQSLPRRVVAPQ